jgi:tRNA-uridine 2-sulfurtransferase
MSRGTIAVALSGGVDSSVAAYLLKEQGYNVIGVHMALFEDDISLAVNDLSSIQKIEDEVREFCRNISIKFQLLDIKREFKKYVIDYFIREYYNGRTPNPCIACNRYIKFGFIFDKLQENNIKFDCLATGHYASVKCYDSTYHLLSARDKIKDQSYFLYHLDQQKLAKIIFPLAGYSKKEVAAIATGIDFYPAIKLSSQDICFIKNRYAEFLERFIQPIPGDIVDVDGNIIGRHKGVTHYTIGQRYGLGIASSGRLYVNKIDHDTNRIVIGSEASLFHKSLIATDLHWVSGKPPDKVSDIEVKIRYGMVKVPVQLTVRNNSAYVVFEKKQKAITPGQSVVFYHQGEVLGGGIIENHAE